jgi:quercetin dioxygenase-like cupin family protein
MVELVRAAEQPYGVEIHTSDGVFIKQMTIPKAGTIVPQHVHSYSHASMLAVGSVRVWKNGVLAAVEKAPKAIEIEAGVAHTFQSLEDNTILYCIHNISRTGEVEIEREHQIVGAA